MKLATFLALAVVLMIPRAVDAAPGSSSSPAPGGANQRSALQGCANQWLFDGIWRLKVDSVTPLSDPDMAGYFGWGVTVELRNGTSADYTPISTGFQNLELAFADGSTLQVDATTQGELDAQVLEYHDFPQATGFKHKLTFWYPANTQQSAVQKPVKFVVLIDPTYRAQHADSGQPNYTTANPSFRVMLNCPSK